MTHVRMSMAAAIVQFLKQQYVERDGVEARLVPAIAGIFGHGNVAGLGQAIEELGGDALPFIQPKSEQGMVHMAIAYAKARNRLSTFACTTSIGPGATNLVTGAATATINRLPVLLLPGDIFASRLPSPVLQQLEHPVSMDVSVNDCLRPVSRYWDRMNRPEQILSALPEAMRVLASPAETGAVTICLPEDVQVEAYDYPAVFFEKRVHTVTRPRAGSEEIAEAARAIRNAARPFLVAGGGVRYSEATAALAALVDRTGIPAGVTQAGKGTLPDDHPSCMGALGATGTLAANRLAGDADLVILAGTRLSDFTTASKTLFQNPRVRFLAIQINAFDAHKHGALPLIGDARAVLEDLTTALDGFTVRPELEREMAEATREWASVREDLVHPEKTRGQRLLQSEVIGILNETLGENATIVHAAGGLPGDVHKLWRSRSALDYHSEYGYSCMGYEIAGALGVKMAQPDREVVALVGDGSYLMLHTELVTAVQEGRKVTIVLVDNGGYQCIHGLQQQCGGRSFGNEFRRRSRERGPLDGELLEIDYVRNAESLGAAACRAQTRAELVAALERARAETRPTLIHVPVEVGAPALPGYAWWDVPVSDSSRLPSVREARDRYEAAVSTRRFHH